MSNKPCIKYIEEENKYLFLNSMTGEVIGYLENLSNDISSINIITKKQEEYLESSKDKYGLEEKTFKVYSSYVKSNAVVELQLSKLKLTSMQYAIYLLLKNHIAPKTNIVKLKRNQYMNKKYIMEYLGITENYLYKNMKLLEELEIIKIIKKDKKEIIYFNPYISYKGTTISVETEKIFNNSKWNTFRKNIESEENNESESE